MLTNHLKGYSKITTHCNRVNNKTGTIRLLLYVQRWQPGRGGREGTQLYFSNLIFQLNLEMSLEQPRYEVFADGNATQFSILQGNHLIKARYCSVYGS